MRKDYRPYYLKRLDLNFRKWYVEHFLRPQFQHLGKGCTFMKPWYVQVFGWPVDIGDFATVISTPDRRVRLTVWGREKGDGFIKIGKYSLICPGVQDECSHRHHLGRQLHDGQQRLHHRLRLARHL